MNCAMMDDDGYGRYSDDISLKELNKGVLPTLHDKNEVPMGDWKEHDENEVEKVKLKIDVKVTAE